MDKQPRVLVLGIGNLLWADEGFGVRAAEEFYRRFENAPNIQVMDGGTQGIYLVQHIRETDMLVVFDAVDYQLKPGTMKLVEGDEVPNFLGVKKISLHQTGFQEVLAMAQMMGDYPAHLLLIGVQPVELDDFGGSLRPEVKAQITPALDAARDWLAVLGIALTERKTSLPDDISIASTEMALRAYEEGRPHETEAFRSGDERVLAGGLFSPPDNPDNELDRILGRTGASA